MNKELDYINERIERLKFRIAHPNEYNITPLMKVKINDGAVYKEELAILEKIKERLEAIDNSNPSEALKELQVIYNNIDYLLSDCGDIDEAHESFSAIEERGSCTIIEQALIKAQEQEKVLDIIKKKNVDVFRFKKLDFNTFNQLQRSCKLPELTQEEFDLLKRWVGYDSKRIF